MSQVIPPEEASSFARKKNALALKKASKGKLYEALDILNEAIVTVPNYPELFWTRSRVFDELGMREQADSDRDRAVQLGYDPEKPPSSDGEKENPREVKERAPGGPGPMSGVSLSIHQKILAMFSSQGKWISLLSIIGIGVGVAVIILLFVVGNGDDGGDVISLEPTPEPTLVAPVLPVATNTPTPTSTPTPALVLLPLTGSPFVATQAQEVWESAGVEVSVVGMTSDMVGFSVQPFDLELSKDGESVQLAILVYDSLDSVSDDWILQVGTRPQAQDGRDLPDHTSVWWNRNLVLIIRPGEASISSAVFDAFISLDP